MGTKLGEGARAKLGDVPPGPGLKPSLDLSGVSILIFGAL